MAKYRTIESMPDIRGKRVLVRIDHNVTYDKQGILKDDRKLRASLPSIEYLIDRGAKIILMTHVGRPKGEVDESIRTRPIAEHLKKMSKKIRSIKTVQQLYGPEVDSAIQKLKEGDILYLENVRFFPGEKENTEAHIDALARLGELYVNDAFPSLHTYEEASTCGVARRLPAYAGFQLIKEVEYLGKVFEDPRRPIILIISGAKMKTKIPVIEHFLAKGDEILLGGAVANTFIAARGFDIGKSKYESEFMEKAQEIMLEGDKEEKADIHIPRDAVVASDPHEKTCVDLPLEDIEGDMAIFDIGKITVKRYIESITKAGMVIWNGPLGMYEEEQFAEGSRAIAKTIAQETKKRGMISIIGGGDTIDLHTRYKLPLDAYTFVSTGGGAMLEFVSGKCLPALEPLLIR
ncbi:phosphoglycerate kinase [Candidatus Peregrinibacteria bacterium]|nr:phosphoglycerate kinase [Candidatus Peregrinibacteria bacterium]